MQNYGALYLRDEHNSWPIERVIDRANSIILIDDVFAKPPLVKSSALQLMYSLERHGNGAAAAEH